MTFVRDALVAAEFAVTTRTIARWDHGQSPPPSWPPPIYINKRKFRSSDALEICRQAIACAATTTTTTTTIADAKDRLKS
jgi:hypothetical protein